MNALKIYTRDEVKLMLEGMGTHTEESVEYFLDELTPIELPSDEEIKYNAHNHYLKGQLLIEKPSDTEYAFKKGAKWVIDKIKNQNK